MASHWRVGCFMGNPTHYDDRRVGLGFTSVILYQSTSGIVVFVQASVSIARHRWICVYQDADFNPDLLLRSRFVSTRFQSLGSRWTHH